MQIGDKVQVISSDTVQGQVGVIVDINYDHSKHTIGVEFSSRVPMGHDCDGMGRDGYCRWLSPRQLSQMTTCRRSNNNYPVSEKLGEGGNMGVLRKLTTFIKRMGSKSLNAQYRVGWLEIVNDELVPTREGLNALARFMMVDDKATSEALGKLAQERIEEIEEDED